MTKLLDGKTVVITGASSGFGEAMAETFCDAGASLLLVARNAERVNAVASRLQGRGGQVAVLAGDVTKPETFEEILSIALSQWGKLDILINNAGGGGRITPIEEQMPGAIEQCLALNLASVMHACRVIVPQMKAQQSGLIINVTSACAKFAWPGWSVYSAAKAGLSMFSRCLHTELRPHGIGVTVLVPGGSNTGFQSAAGIGGFEWDDAQSLRPEHIAHAALSVATMPAGVVVPEMVIYGQAQDIVPF